jgi:tetratricopeptide (TPR) repeat protein
MNTHRIGFLALLMVSFAVADSFANDPQKSWVGEFVLPLKPTKEIKFWDLTGKKEVQLPFSGVWPFKVRAEEDGRLRIHDGRREGWVAKKDFIPGRDALSYFDDRVDDDPKDSWALFMLGSIALLQGEPDDAVSRLTDCLKVAPNHVDAYVKRGQAWRAKDEPEKAIKDFDAAIRLEQKHGAAFRNRATVWAMKAEKGADAKDIAKAAKDFAEAIRLDPDDADAFYHRGMMWMRKSDHAAALKDFDELVRLTPDNSFSFLIRGAALKEMKKYGNALKDHDEAVRLAPKSVRILDARGNLLHFMKEYDRAIADFDAVIEIEPEDASAFAHRGFAKCGKKQFAQAIEDYDEALRLDPMESWAGLNRPVTLLLLRKPGAADGSRRFLEVHGFKHRLSAYAGIIGHLAARQEKAEEPAKQFLKDAGKFGNAWPAPVFKFLRGEIDADALLARAKSNGEQTEARCYLGLHYMLKDQKEEAAAHFRWVAENGDPGYIEFLVARAELDCITSPTPKRR